MLLMQQPPRPDSDPPPLTICKDMSNELWVLCRTGKNDSSIATRPSLPSLNRQRVITMNHN